MLPFSKIQTASYHKRVAHGESGNECIRCGRETRMENFVEMDNGCGESQGFFPVGPECLKILKKMGANVLTAAEVEPEP